MESSACFLIVERLTKISLHHGFTLPIRKNATSTLGLKGFLMTIRKKIPHSPDSSTGTMDESLVQQIMEWNSVKDSESLLKQIQDAENEPDQYSPELIEGTRRILATRGILQHTSIQGHHPPKAGEIVRVRLRNGSIKTFGSHSEFTHALVRGEITRPDQVQAEPWPIKENHDENPEWVSLREFTQSHLALDVLYRPLGAHITRGFKIGSLVLLSLNFFHVQVPPGLIHNTSLQVEIHQFLFALVEGIGLTWVLTPYFKKRLWDRKCLWLAILSIPSMNLISTLSSQEIQPGLVWDFLFMGLAELDGLFYALFIGGPIGMGVGTLIGYIRRWNLPRAADASPEGNQAYVLGILYPGLVLMIMWAWIQWNPPSFFILISFPTP